MDDETSMSIPLDDDGFLRRECPTCEREFKWFVSQDEGADDSPQAGYYCPYCGIQSQPDQFLTKEQASLALNTVVRDLVVPAVDRWGKGMKRHQRPSDIVRVDIEMETPGKMDPLVEVNDMVRVDFGCHPAEPLKVSEEWSGAVRCLVCGEPAQT